jgi:hypothetical protein
LPNLRAERRPSSPRSTNRAIPKDKEKYDTLINFIALAATRVPTMRTLVSKPIEDIAEKIARIMVSTKERFEQSFPNAAAEGLTYEAAREFVHHGMKVRATNATYINRIMSLVETIMPYLDMRNWCVCYNDNGGEHFVVTDNPVVVSWSDGRPPGFFGPAHGKSATDVTIPLSSHVALLGRFEDLPDTEAFDAKTVGAFNAKTVMYSQRFIASCDYRFLFHTVDGGLMSDKEVVTAIEKAAAEDNKTK